MSRDVAAQDNGLVIPDRVTTLVRGLISAAVAPGSSWTYESLGAACKLTPRRLKSYVHEGKEPPLSAALSIGVVLGKPAINGVLALIGYGGAAPLDELPQDCPLDSAVAASSALSRFLVAAADRRIDYREEPEATAAADLIIAEMIPFSSAGKAS